MTGRTIEKQGRSYAQLTLLDTVKDSVPNVNQEAYSLADAFILPVAPEAAGGKDIGGYAGDDEAVEYNPNIP